MTKGRLEAFSDGVRDGAAGGRHRLLDPAVAAPEGPAGTLAHARHVRPRSESNLSPFLYLAAIASAFVSPWISHFIYVSVALIWLVPDSRIERRYQP
jgi:uncharacterized membrane protein